MFATVIVVLYSAFYASVVAQSSSLSIVCVAGQCLQGFSNTTLGAKLSASGAPSSVQLLPGQYSTTTNPQLLHSLLTSSSATLNSSPGFNSSSQVSLPLNLALQPGLAIYAQSLYAGQSGFSALPSEPLVNVSTPLPAGSISLSNNVWVAVTSGANKDRTVLWDAVPDVAQLPSSTSGGLSLVDIQSSACSPPCSGSGICSASGTCTCPPGFTGSSCESCAEGFFGPTCQACPKGCVSCDQGISGSGRCLTLLVPNAPSTCNCLNGQCGSNGQCTCNPGWTTAGNGTACAKCSSGFFLDTAGDCQVCQLGCDQCADGTATCISCKSGFTQNANDKSKCDPLPNTTTGGTTCPDGSFSSGTQCSPCSSACRTCKGPSSNDCLVCAAGTYLFNGNCVGTNSDGVCQGTNGMIADNNKRECDTCGAKCTSCRIPNFSVASTVDQLQCTGCLPGFVLSAGKCIESCPAGTFVSPQDNLTCTPCSSSCGTCAGSANFCLTCTGSQLASNGQCVSTCPSNTFASTTSTPGSCTQCHPDCASCSGSSFNQCTSCPPSRPVLSNGRCLPTCAKSQYFDRTTSSCQTCDSSCSSCSGPGPSNCLACASSTQVLRAGACVDANCEGSTSVIPGLGVCLSELVQVPKASGTSTPTPIATVTGLTEPADLGGKKALEWWQILLMALGCAFIFVMFLMCWRRRARKQRKEQTKMFASAKRLDRPHGWKERLVRFGERLFGHRDRMFWGKRKQADVLPTTYKYDRQERTRSLAISDYGQDMKMSKITSPTSGQEARLLTKPKSDIKVHTTANPIAKRETVDDVDQLIDAYNYSRHSAVSSRPPSTLPDLEERRPKYAQNQHRRIERESLYEEVTGKQRNTPEPRQPLRREPSGASMFSSTRSMRLAGAGTRNLTGGTREGVLVDLEEDGKKTPQLQLPLQMVNSGTPLPRPTDAQVYAMAVRPELVGVASQPQPQAPPQLPPQPPFAPISIAPTTSTGGFSPIPVTLTSNTTGSQGSYWLTPVVPNATGGSLQMQMPFQQPQLETSPLRQLPSSDTVILHPTPGGSGSRNPFRQGSY